MADKDADVPDSPGWVTTTTTYREDVLGQWAGDDVVEAVKRVFSHGAKKHSLDGWQNLTIDEHMQAMLRHAGRLKDGRGMDEESGELHAAHMATRALMVLWFCLRR